MQEDFHYYATYCAAIISGYEHEEALDIAYSAQLVDLCSKTFLNRIKAPHIAATTQLQLEMMDARTDVIGLQEITRIWASFHFLPYDLYAQKEHRTKRYMMRYRLICRPNGDLVVKTVELAKNRPLQSVGIAMHVLADTWAHMNFAGTPSLVINNTTAEFTEFVKADEGEKEVERKIKFRHNPSAPDDLEKGIFTNSLFQGNEHSIMNLGHGRAGHLPDYSYIKYRYVPAWNDYKDIIKDNPSDYIMAFTQMITALKYLNGKIERFEKETYDYDAIEEYRDRIDDILRKRQHNACDDWKKFGEELSGKEIPDFDLEKYVDEFVRSNKRNRNYTFLAKFVMGAIAHKGMVTNEIFKSGNLLAGFTKEIRIPRKEETA
ncbi:DUF6765 family protein [Butyrivibrio proteoclasticus]|uniref:DUF6765 family protein n=1 Tax=Butyrivibrio proteoclasticus TaxID=43305 RepID=UPI00047D3F2D|nr:DUF6765 family protein [Butyrivibrio proteoclasticus]